MNSIAKAIIALGLMATIVIICIHFDILWLIWFLLILVFMF